MAAAKVQSRSLDILVASIRMQWLRTANLRSEKYCKQSRTIILDFSKKCYRLLSKTGGFASIRIVFLELAAH
jgi:hypothetical protein